MIKQRFLVRTNIAIALLSALVLTQTAHAGLLGGGSGGLGGGAGLGGGFGPRSLDIGGNAAGQISRDGGQLPRSQRALEKTSDVKAIAIDKTDAAKQSSTDRAGNLGGMAEGSAAGSATASRRGEAPTATPGAMTAPTTAMPTPAAMQTPTPSPMPTATPTPASTGSAGGNGGAALATRKVDASFTGSAQASRADRSVGAEGSAQGSARR